MLTADRSLAAALAYARWFGWAVFPVGGNEGKRPLVDDGVKDASGDAETIRRMWPRRPCNIAVAAGAASSFWVLDVDGEEGSQSLANLQRQHGALPETPRQLTPSRGEHLFFSYGPGLCNRVRFAPGLDVRTDGGYVVVPPSTAPGRARPWASDIDRDISETPLAPAPDWLVALVEQSTATHSNSNTPAWVEIAAGRVPEGHRNDTAIRIGHLLRRWVDPELAHVLIGWNAVRCQPPLPQDELAPTFNSVLGRWLGLQTMHCPAYGVLCEDSCDERATADDHRW